MKFQKFGVSKNGEEISLITLENKNGMKAVLTDMGACLVSLFVKDKNGKLVDVVAGFDTLQEYEENPTFFGATIGRNGNRIDGPKFTINGKEYKLFDQKAGTNCHSVPNGYNSRKWNYETDNEDGESVTFFIYSPDGDQGFPGNLDVEVTYTLTDENELMIQYYGLSDQDTVFNMTNHSYFNLNGHNSGDILNHTVYLYSDGYNTTDSRLIPTGEIVPVEGTPFDFRNGRKIGTDIHSDNYDLNTANGYDHNFVINGGKKIEDAELFGKCIGDKSGIVMEMYTDLPGVQMYAGNFTVYDHGKENFDYKQHCAVAFETQYTPNAINMDPEKFARPLIKAGEEFVSLTVYSFSTVE